MRHIPRIVMTDTVNRMMTRSCVLPDRLEGCQRGAHTNGTACPRGRYHPHLVFIPFHSTRTVSTRECTHSQWRPVFPPLKKLAEGGPARPAAMASLGPASRLACLVALVAMLATNWRRLRTTSRDERTDAMLEASAADIAAQLQDAREATFVLVKGSSVQDANVNGFLVLAGVAALTMPDVRFAITHDRLGLRDLLPQRQRAALPAHVYNDLLLALPAMAADSFAALGIEDVPLLELRASTRAEGCEACHAAGRDFCFSGSADTGDAICVDHAKDACPFGRKGQFMSIDAANRDIRANKGNKDQLGGRPVGCPLSASRFHRFVRKYRMPLVVDVLGVDPDSSQGSATRAQEHDATFPLVAFCFWPRSSPRAAALAEAAKAASQQLADVSFTYFDTTAAKAELLEHFSLPSAMAEEIQLVVQTTGSDEPERRTLRNLRSDGLTAAVVLAARELIDKPVPVAPARAFPMPRVPIDKSSPVAR